MKQYKTTRKKKMLKKYNKTQFRRFNKHNNLTSKMKGGMIYTKYRKTQLARIRAILSELGHTKKPGLRKLIDKLEHLLRNHIKTVSVDGGIWRKDARIDQLIRTINNNLESPVSTVNKNQGSEIKGIPVDNTIPPVHETKLYNDDEDENKSSLQERSSIRPYSIRPYSRTLYDRSSIRKSKTKGRDI